MLVVVISIGAGARTTLTTPGTGVKDFGATTTEALTKDTLTTPGTGVMATGAIAIVAGVKATVEGKAKLKLGGSVEVAISGLEISSAPPPVKSKIVLPEVA